MYEDLPFPAAVCPAGSDSVGCLGEGFGDEMSAFRDNHTFVSDLCFAVEEKGNAQ